MLTLLLRARFGPVDAPIVGRIQRAGLVELKLWCKRAISVERLEDVFRRSRARRPKRT